MVVERPIVEGTLAERSINDGTVIEELAVEDLLNKKFDVDSLAVKWSVVENINWIYVVLPFQ